MSQAQSSSQPPSLLTIIRGLVPSLIIGGLLPYVIYQLLKQYTSASDLVALIISAVPAAIWALVGIVRRRQLDLIAALTLVGIAVSIVASFLGGDPKLFLIRESFLTVALAIACMVSLLLPRPLMFYFGRYFATGNDPARLAEFNGYWQYAGFRSFMRILTVIWGIAYISEFILRIILVYSLSIPQFLLISPFIFNGITIGLIAFTIAYSNYTRRRGEARRRQLAAEAEAAPPAEVETN